MEITRSAINRDRVTWVALFVVALAGLITYFQLPKNQDPGFIVRWATVVTYFPGASPERVQMLISDKIEKAIQEMSQVKTINSTSKTGASIVSLQIKPDYKDMRPIWDELRRKVEWAKRSLPEGVMGPFVFDDLGDVYGVVLTITGDGYSYADLKEVADQVRDELLRISEVAKVQLYGAQDERLFVEYNNAQLSQSGLSPGQLANLLASQNIINPGGQVVTDRERIVLEPTGSFESLEDLKRCVIQIPATRELVYLEDIAKVYRGYVDPPETVVRANGLPAVGLGVSLREGGNITIMGDKINGLLAHLQAQYPIGIEFELQYFLPERVEETISNFIESLIQAVLMVTGVMLLTLGLKTGLLVASLIPMAILATFMFMGFAGIWLDQVSVAALMIALGLLVDNAIVMSESIMVQINSGVSRKEAAIKSAKELKIPLLVSSLTTAAAFLPIFLAKSEVGEYTAPLFKVVTIALLCSWVLSMTMMPLLCMLFIKAKSKKASEDNRLDSSIYRMYRGFLLLLLRNRAITLVVTIGVLVLSLYGFGFVPKLFFPTLDDEFFYGKITLPEGTPIERTARVVADLESFVNQELMVGEKREQGVVHFASFVGGNEPVFTLGYPMSRASPNFTMMMFTISSIEMLDPLMKKLSDYCMENLPDVEASFQRLSNGPPVNYPIEVRLYSKDMDELFSLVDKVRTKLSDIPGTRNISDNWGQWTKKFIVHVNQERSRRAHVSSRDVATSLQSVLSGMQTTQYREDDKVIPVVLRSQKADRKDLGKLESLNVFSQQTQKPVPLKQVADVKLVWEPSQILRRDLYLAVSVKSELQPGANAAQIASVLTPWLEELSKDFDLGTSYELGGENESSDEANQSIGDQMPIAMLIILLLLVGQFNSLRRTLIVLTSILLGLIGVVCGLLIMDSYFGFMTLLGIVSLAGIVINNAIVLLDRIKLEIEQNGLEPRRAVIQAAQMRMRPILLTTATTIGGLIPLYLGGGAMWEPMTVAIMFGLLVSTVLTLGIVPTLYSGLFRVSFKGFKW